ncbi:TPA: hypothetical protein I8Y83_002772 [Legionella pneumophila]|uniref:CopG family transcriptional regulator n=1 Tax=Legionella bozemanae TaxID=447 RepID=A0A0W0REN0_LEGBO|nr:hypothetical protein [Legionella bozemanae]KTC69553.1 hypothetical protein Lboz_3069 [Legionella bozemanae]STP10151.1 Uncharacterised protein [Legionella bozemanae]HAT1722217.1 hypothetical protein [Legionella pneumophila]
MPLITEDKIKQTEKIRVEIDANIYKEIQAYSEWAKLKGTDTFFEKSALYILAKDKKWKASDEYSMID